MFVGIHFELIPSQAEIKLGHNFLPREGFLLLRNDSIEFHQKVFLIYYLILFLYSKNSAGQLKWNPVFSDDPSNCHARKLDDS